MNTGCHATRDSVQQALTNPSIMNAWSPRHCTVVWVVAGEVEWTFNKTA